MISNNIIKLAVYEAGLVIEEEFHDFKPYATKSSFTDLVTDTDKKVEKKLKDKLLDILPESSIIAEESENNKRILNNKSVWIIDPIDGTTNFVHGFPFLCISVALMQEGRLEKAVVYNPILKEMFEASRCEGAFLNNKKIHVTNTKKLSQSLLATGFAYNFATDKENNMRYFEHFRAKVHGIRRAGSAALDLCYVAKGVFDSFWEWYLNPWDIAAGILIIEEAGGKITNLNGNKFSFLDDNILASNNLIHNEMVAVAKEATIKK